MVRGSSRKARVEVPGRHYGQLFRMSSCELLGKLLDGSGKLGEAPCVELLESPLGHHPGKLRWKFLGSSWKARGGSGMLLEKFHWEVHV